MHTLSALDISLARDRLASRAKVFDYHYRSMFKYEFANYIRENGFNLIHVSMMEVSELDAMWKMFVEDGKENS